MATNKSKTVSSNTQTNTPGFATPPSTPQETKLEGMVGNVDFASPIRNQYERARQQNSRSYNNPLGAFTTQDVRDKSEREQNAQFGQSEAIALGNAAQQNQQNAFGQQATVAGLMQPRFYNAQTTNTGSTSQPFTGGDVLGMGLGAGSNLLTMF